MRFLPLGLHQGSWVRASAELRKRIEAAVATITEDTLINVWEELGYRLDLCRVTNGSHIEHLLGS